MSAGHGCCCVTVRPDAQDYGEHITEQKQISRKRSAPISPGRFRGPRRDKLRACRIVHVACAGAAAIIAVITVAVVLLVVPTSRGHPARLARRPAAPGLRPSLLG